MKKIVFSLILMFGLTLPALAQESETHEVEKSTYYEQRAKEDALFEQSIKEGDEREADFWTDQKEYERDLKKRDRKAYRAYMKGKRDAYAEHHAHCSHECHHSHGYYVYASYYYGEPYYHRRSAHTTAVRTSIGIRTPGVRVSF